MTDKQKKLLAKYSRIGEDRSQLQQFTKDVITGEIGGGGGSGGEENPLKTVSLEMGYSDFTPVTSKVFNITNQNLIPLIDEVFNTKAALSYKISGENGTYYTTEECVCLYVEDIDGEHFEIYDRDYQTKTFKRCFIVTKTSAYYQLFLEDLSNCPAGEIANYCMNNNLKMKFEFTLPISSGSGSDPADAGSGKLYEFKFNLTRYNNEGSIVRWSSNVVGIQQDSLPISIFIYESNWERYKQKFSELATALGISITIPNTPEDLRDLLNSLLSQTIGQTSNNVSTMFVLCMKYADKVVGYSGNGYVPYLMVSDLGLATTVAFVAPGGIDRHTFTGYDSESGQDYFYGLNVNNSCTLTEYGTSAGGGSVDAEPIVSIKMINMDLRPADDSSSTELDNVQLYCTKETWNNMVAYAKQLSSSLDITYANFGTIYATLSAQTQGALVGFLMMDYLNGKVLPNSYTEIPLSVAGSNANIQRFLNLTNTFQGENTSNVKVILGAVFGGSGSGSYFPSLDRTAVPYTTADTVITVEEIDGPAIGASGDSGTSDVLYKHSMVVYLQGDIPEEEPSPLQFNFLSKYAEPFVTNGSLADFITAFAAKNDFQAVIQPSVNEINGSSGFYVSNIVPDDTKITLLCVANNSTNYTLGFKFVDNASGITDTVTPYVQVNGGSGSSTTTSQYDYIQMCFNSSNNSHIILMFDKQYSRADDVAPTVNQLITTLNQMGNLSIPAYTDLESLADIADYLNVLDTQTYAQIKVVFWASVFSLYPYLCLSVKGYNNGMLVPVIVEGIADMGNQNFAYTIKMMDNTGAMVTEASEQTVFDFDIFVNQLD